MTNDSSTNRKLLRLPRGLRETIAHAKRLTPLIVLKWDLVDALKPYVDCSFYDFGNDATGQRITIRNDHVEPKPHVHVALGDADIVSAARTGVLYITWNDFVIPQDKGAPVAKRTWVQEVDRRTRQVRTTGSSFTRPTVPRPPDELDARADSIADEDDMHKIVLSVRLIASNYRLLTSKQ